MSRSVRARWWHFAAFVAVGVVVSAGCLLVGHEPGAAFALAAAMVIACCVSPLRRDRSTSHWEAQARHVREGAVVVYWRPGCWQCLRMRLLLGSVGRRVSWVDVWADAEGAAYVRDLNDGVEKVPTVILGDGSAHANPPPDLVRDSIAA